MSIDKKIHNLIEQQDNKGKQESWARIQSRLEEADDESGEVENGNSTRAVIFSKKAILSSICAAALLITVILLIVFVPRKSDGDFLTSDNDYSIVASDCTIKNYAAQTGNDFLYFDWYNKTEYEDKIIKLNSTDKIICYQETVTDMETGYVINYYITDLKTNIDILTKYKECNNIQTINDTKVKWKDSFLTVYSTFDYKGFRYYIEIAECESPEVLLGYVEQLLN